MRCLSVQSLKKTAFLCSAACLLAFTLSACKKEEAKPTPAPTPEKVVYDPVKAQEKASKRIANVDIDATPLPHGSDYIKLVAQENTDTQDVAPFLNGLPSDDTKTVIILAHIENGDTLKLPSVPLFIFERDQSKWVNAFQASGSLTPFFVAQRAPLSVSLEMILLKDKLDNLSTDAQKLVQAYATNLPLYSSEGAHDISTLADEFIQRIALIEEHSFKDLSSFSVSYLENFASSLELLGGQGQTGMRLTLNVEGKPSVLPLHHNRPPSYNDLMAYQIGKHSPRSALGDLESGFWSVPNDVFGATCKAIQGALMERLGLSKRDSAIVLWSMIQPHARFANGIDYTQDCTGEDVASLLTEAGLALPPLQAPRASRNTQNAMNKTLSNVARLVKNSRDDTEAKMAALMDDTLLVRDQARLLFSTEPDQLVSSTIDVVAPTLKAQEAAEYLSMLPIQAYGCYTKSTGQVGTHRATLVKLENDPSLWLLNFAFNEQKKISGIQLRAASQKDFCRAIGGRTGKNSCAFSGKDFPGLQSDRCG